MDCEKQTKWIEIHQSQCQLKCYVLCYVMLCYVMLCFTLLIYKLGPMLLLYVWTLKKENSEELKNKSWILSKDF